MRGEGLQCICKEETVNTYIQGHRWWGGGEDPEVQTYIPMKKLMHAKNKLNLF